MGSSSRKTSYRLSSREARPARAAWPPERAVIGWSRSTVSPSSAATWAARSSRSAPPSSSHRSSAPAYASSAPAVPSVSASVAASSAACAPVTPVRRARKSRTVSPARRSGSCGRYPTEAPGGLNETLPSSTPCNPASVRSNVDFPAPLTPTSPTTSPGATTRSRSLKSIRSPCPAASPLTIIVALMRPRAYRPPIRARTPRGAAHACPGSWLRVADLAAGRQPGRIAGWRDRRGGHGPAVTVRWG